MADYGALIALKVEIRLLLLSQRRFVCTER